MLLTQGKFWYITENVLCFEKNLPQHKVLASYFSLEHV